jgi:hypothetical protein
MMAFHVEAGFDVDMPALVDERYKFLNKRTPQTGFASAEGHPTARGQKIEVVDGQFLCEFVGGHHAQDAVGALALGVEAIAAAKGTAMKGHQGGDPLAIDRQPMA